MSHDSRCACHIGATCGEPESQTIESCPRCGAPCEKYGASNHKYQYINTELIEAVQYALDAYDHRVRNGLMPMGKIDSMERLRRLIPSQKCTAFYDGKYCNLPIFHEGKCQYVRD